MHKAVLIGCSMAALLVFAETAMAGSNPATTVTTSPVTAVVTPAVTVTGTTGTTEASGALGGASIIVTLSPAGQFTFTLQGGATTRSFD